MLPDYPEVKARLMAERMKTFQRDMDSDMPMVSRFRHVRFHEGHQFSFERSDDVVEVQDFLDVKKPIAVSTTLDSTRP